MKRCLLCLLSMLLVLTAASCGSQHSAESMPESSSSTSNTVSETVSSESENLPTVSETTVNEDDVLSAEELFQRLNDELKLPQETVRVDAKYLNDVLKEEPAFDFYGETTLSMNNVETLIVIVAKSNDQAGSLVKAFEKAMDTEHSLSTVRDISKVLHNGRYVVFITSSGEVNESLLTDKLNK